MSSVFCASALFVVGTLRVWCTPGLHRTSILLSSAAAAIVTVFRGLEHDYAFAVFSLTVWHPLTWYIASSWTWFASHYVLLPTWVLTGPLGKGCSKVIEVAIGAISCKMIRGIIPLVFLPKGWVSHQNILLYGLALALFSAAVNSVLGVWFKVTRSRGEHQGLKEYSAHHSPQTPLKKHAELLALAFVNAFCEECTSRGFWRHEFTETSGLSWANANIAQALLFGAWHFHGVPSGWSGVGLTFLYGLLMGWLCDWSGGGLLLPILTHAVADYYIFAFIMQRKLERQQ